MADLTEADLSNLITACMTSKMRDGNEGWQKCLNEIAEKLRAARSAMDSRPAANNATA